MDPLRVTSERRDRRYVIELAGELDLRSEGELVTELERAEASDAQEIVLDLSRLEFIDSTGIKVLVLAANRSRASGRLGLLRGPEEVQHVLRIAEVESELPFVDA